MMMVRSIRLTVSLQQDILAKECTIMQHFLEVNLVTPSYSNLAVHIPQLFPNRVELLLSHYIYKADHDLIGKHNLLYKSLILRILIPLSR